MNVTSLFRSPVADAVREGIAFATSGRSKRANPPQVAPGTEGPKSHHAAQHHGEMGPAQRLGRSAADHAVRLAMNSISRSPRPHPEAAKPDVVDTASAAAHNRPISDAALERMVRPIVDGAVRDALAVATGRDARAPDDVRAPAPEPTPEPSAALTAPAAAPPMSRLDLRELIGRVVREALAQVFRDFRSDPHFLADASKLTAMAGDQRPVGDIIVNPAEERSV